MPIELSAIDKNKLYRSREAARLLDKTDQTIRRLIKSGKIQATKSGREWLIKGAELIQYLTK